ncbi:hypothetical protein EDB19DRAFT_79007 [Suillus lakei]|nr:hypothetical protein EDB19DRAFT_79007 [Suillus lakei]
MSTFPIFNNLHSPASFPGLPSFYSAEQISLPPMEQPLYDHQKAADLAALEAVSEDDLLAIIRLLSSSVPGAHSLPGDHPTVLEESPSKFQNDSTAAIRTKPPYPRVAHACDHCRRRKIKCSGEQPMCTSCKKRGRVCHWTPLKTTKERRSRNPYDVGIEYNPRPRAPAPSAPYIVAPRATYSSVMHPNPMAIWSIEDSISSQGGNAPTGWSVPAQYDCQEAYPTNAPSVKPPMQAPTGWGVPAQYDWQDVDVDVHWIPSPPSSCPSLGSDMSSRGSSPLGTPTSANSSLDSASPLFYSVEEAASNFDAIVNDLYQGLSPEWSSFLQSWSDETEMLFAQ